VLRVRHAKFDLERVAIIDQPPALLDTALFADRDAGVDIGKRLSETHRLHEQMIVGPVGNRVAVIAVDAHCRVDVVATVPINGAEVIVHSVHHEQRRVLLQQHHVANARHRAYESVRVAQRCRIRGRISGCATRHDIGMDRLRLRR
tara:strand:- start:2258 stop:2695 length:438 start_codon:yes stop_codon:yes gene_type:complete